jgi:hypothetical protein
MTKDKPSKFPLRWIIAVLVFLGGGGASTFHFMTAEEVDKKVDTKTKPIEKMIIENKKADDARHVTIDHTFKKITRKIDRVQDVQHWQVADQAAERVSKDAPKKKQEEKRRLLFKWNMQRLKEKPPKMPCSNLDCTN